MDRGRIDGTEADSHVAGVAILHIGFLGTRHTALVSADDKGMAFSHLATRGLGAIARSVRTTRILGRYPDILPRSTRPRKPSSVLAFSPLPLGNAEHITDNMGLVAIMTPYLLVIVSTIPVAQTQHKATRPKELAAHGAMTAVLAWFPPMKPIAKDTLSSDTVSSAKLAYCWSNILIILDVLEAEASESSTGDKLPELQFILCKRWQADEAVVAIQWISRSVLGLITISQQLIILEVSSLQVSDSSDLIKKHIYHVDLFSQQLSQLIEKLDEEDASMHGVVADAFYMSFKAYKGRLFLLGFSDLSMGTLSNWADRLLALMEDGNFIGAIELATSYYNGEGDKATVGLPEDDVSRHSVVQEKLLEMILASLKYAFGRNQEAGTPRVAKSQLKDLATACFNACLSIDYMDFLFEEIYTWYHEEHLSDVFLQTLERYITDGAINTLPPSILKDLIGHFVEQGRDSQLEETLCRLNPETMDIDQVTSLCKQYRLYDALFYVWNQALGDYTTLLEDLLGLQKGTEIEESINGSSKIFPYMSYILTGRVYPTGKVMPDAKATAAKADIYHFIFSGDSKTTPSTNGSSHEAVLSFPHLREILHFDTASFLSMLNEAFEDSFLNGPSDQAQESGNAFTDDQKFGLSLNRQYIISILLEIMISPEYGAEDIIYLDMFIARNLPKFPQFVLLPGSTLYRVLLELCNYPRADIAEDCQLSVEYLLSVYQPTDLLAIIPLLSKARFFRVMKSIYKQERLYAQLLQTCFDDYDNPDEILICIADCLKPNAGLNQKQTEDVRAVIIENGAALLQARLTEAASTLNQYAPDLHGAMLDSLNNDEQAHFQYLQTILEPNRASTTIDIKQRGNVNQDFVERYVRLLCDYDPHHVSEYVEKLKMGDLRLDSVLPALESSGVVDATVILLAREGKVQESVDRLTQHLHTLGAALVGLFRGADQTPDFANMQEAANDLVESLQKYARIGVWLCQGLSNSTAQAKIPNSHLNRKQPVQNALSLDENIWLDLVDSVVQVVRDISGSLEGQPSTTQSRGMNEDRRSQQSKPFESTNILASLRSIVQETFTALLTATSVPPATEVRSTDLSFLRIFRAFLNRASLSSPSLSNLRAVLAAIFSAYSYEESLLALANRLLNKDLFVHVSEVSILRKRGWRPLGQVCEGCGQRVLGPGAGGGIWDAWIEAGQVAEAASVSFKATLSFKTPSAKGKGKGKVPTDQEDDSEDEGQGDSTDGKGSRIAASLGPLVIFSCRHIFHRTCVEEMQAQAEVQGPAQALRLEFACPLCT